MGPSCSIPPRGWLLAALVTLVWLGAGGCTVDFSAPNPPSGDAGTDGGGICGDGVRGPGESCDGTDLGGADCESETGVAGGTLGCTPACTVDLSGCRACGNGELNGEESCDDGNEADGDGCDVGCQVEPGWTCDGEPSICATVCGDASIIGSETCDDGNVDNGDGCDANCRVEPGWTCEGEPSVCANPCGDGTVGPGEACDDGNRQVGDGCNDLCEVEDGWSCAGSHPSLCEPVCGDLKRVGDESCDDGGQEDGDGCSATCEVEPFFACDGEPSECTCVVYVDRNGASLLKNGGSWTTAFDTLPPAITMAANRTPCEIWVAQGTYYRYQTNVANTLGLLDHTHLYGGFAGTETARAARDWVAYPTEISAEQQGNAANRVRTVVTANGDTDVVIDGFRITRATPSGYASQGGGLVVDSGSNVQVQNCVFEDNTARDGGAVAVLGGTLVLEDSELLSNVAEDDGGGLYAEQATLEVRRTVLRDNQSGDDGGAMCISASELTLERSRFLSNIATGFGGGARLVNSRSTVALSIFAFNESGDGGGGISVNQDGGPDVVVRHCTLWDNQAPFLVGRHIRVLDATMQVINSIVWSSTVSTALIVTNNGHVDLNYSLVPSTYSGVGLVHQAPQLEDPTLEDFRLQAGSPAIDAANGNESTTEDIEMLPRVDDPQTNNTGWGVPNYCDIGAHEYQP